MHGSDPASPRQRRALGIGNGDDGNVGKDVVQRLELGNVESAVNRRDVRGRQAARQREMELPKVEVDDVELVRTPGDFLEHEDVRRQVVAPAPAES